MRISLKYCSFVAMIVLFSLVLPVHANDSAFKNTGVYSNMYYNEEGGDVLGVEIFLVYSKEGSVVVFQSSEGEPEVPVVAKADIDGDMIEFILPEGHGYSGKFSGTISSKGIVGSFMGGDKLVLKKKNSYWQ